MTYIGSAESTSPGRLLETDSNVNIIHEWPEDVPSVFNILSEHFSPYWLSVDWNKNTFLTSDLVVPVTILKSTTGKVSANTLRLWDLECQNLLIRPTKYPSPNIPQKVFQTTVLPVPKKAMPSLVAITGNS